MKGLVDSLLFYLGKGQSTHTKGWYSLQRGAHGMNGLLFLQISILIKEDPMEGLANPCLRIILLSQGLLEKGRLILLLA